ncbi:hypothetical protein LEMLEM_LOCUS17933 [Lemmus lemmus]
MEHQCKSDVDCGLSDSECNMGNETRAPLFVGPGIRGPAKHCGRSTGMPRRPSPDPWKKDKMGVFFWPPNLGCNVGNKTGAPLVIGPGLRGPANHRGRGDRCATRTQATPETQTLRSLSLQQISQGPPFLCCPPAFSTALYMTMTLGQQLIASPSMELHEDFGLSNPKNVSDGERKRKQAVKDKGHLQAMGSKGPIASDQTSVSATFKCEEILEAAVALMTLKISSWTWC